MRASLGLGLLLCFAARAFADNYSINVNFSDGNTLSGTFTTNAGNTLITAYVIAVTGPNTSPANTRQFSISTGTGFHIITTPTPGCVGINELQFANAGFTIFSDVCTSAALGSAANIAINSGFDCPGCGTVTSGTLTDLSLITDAYQEHTAANLTHGDAYVNITNGGANGSFLELSGNGDICANVYVFDPGQELLACCSCLVTPDGLNSFSVTNDLISKALIPAVPTSVVIKLVATQTSTTCANSATTAPLLASGMRAWGTTLHSGPAGYVLTETAFQVVTVGTAEATALTQMCGFVLAEGSGNFGFCNNACAKTGLAGAKK